MSEAEDGRSREDAELQARHHDEPFAEAARSLADRLAAYEKAQAGPDYQAQQARMRRLTKDFIQGVRSSSIVFTRMTGNREWLLQASMDDFLESAIGWRPSCGVNRDGRRLLGGDVTRLV